jgi:hypothetical protein
VAWLEQAAPTRSATALLLLLTELRHHLIPRRHLLRLLLELVLLVLLDC